MRGQGDLLVGPYLQWDPIMGQNGPVFMHRVEFQMLLPPAATIAMTRSIRQQLLFDRSVLVGDMVHPAAVDRSWRIHYLWNNENDDPGGGFNTLQAGQRCISTTPPIMKCCRNICASA